MAVVTAATLNATLDDLVLSYLKAVGASGYGIGSSGAGAYDAADDAYNELVATAEADPILDYGRYLRTYRDGLVASSILGPKLKPALAGMSRHCARYGSSNYSDLDTYLTYLNTVGTKWEALQDPNWYDLYNAIKGGSNRPAVNNVYFEALQGTFDLDDHLYTLGMGRFVGSGAGTGTFTEATVEGGLIDGGSSVGSIDSSKYCGGFLKIKIASITGTGDVTVTGIFYDPATKAVTTSKTMITAVTTTGTVTATIGAGTAPTDALIIKVTNIQTSAGITAGTMYCEAHRPTGRPLLK